MSCGDQFMQNTAFPYSVMRTTALAQLRELPLKGTHRFKPRSYLKPLIINQAVNITAIRGRLSSKIQQAPNVRQGYFQSPAVTNKCQALKMTGAVSPIAICLSLRRRQQTFMLVIPNIFDIYARRCSKFSDPHWVISFVPILPLDIEVTTGFLMVA